VIRTFVRSGVTKLAFGLFFATFAYSIVVYVVEGASSSAAVLPLAVTLGVLLVLASLVVFVAYVTATMRIVLFSSLSPVAGFRPTIPWPFRGRTHEDLADDNTAGHGVTNSRPVIGRRQRQLRWQ